MTIDELTDKVIVATRNNAWAKDIVKIHVEQGIYLMVDSGVHETIANSERAVGFLCAYLTDVDTADSGNIKLSAFTKSKLAQLTMLEPIKTEEAKPVYGVLFVDFECEESPVLLNIMQNSIVKYSYQITRAVVEILEVGDYEVELVFPNETIETENVSITENQITEVYKEVKNDEAEKIDVLFSLKNTSGQNLSGYVFKFKNIDTNEEVGEFTTETTEKTISLSEGSYLAVCTYVTGYNAMLDSMQFDVVKGEDNVIEIIKSDDTFGHISVSTYVNKKSQSYFGLDKVLEGTWLIKNAHTLEILQRIECDYENPNTLMYAYGIKDNKTNYIAEFIPKSDLMKPFYKIFSLNVSTAQFYLETVDGTGFLFMYPYIDSSKVSSKVGADIEEYTLKFRNMTTGESFTETFNLTYVKSGTTNWYSNQTTILPAGTYELTIENIKSTEKKYKQASGTITFTLTHQAYQTVNVKMEEVV